MRTAQAGQRRRDVRDVRVAVDEAAVVIAEADEAAEVGVGGRDRSVANRCDFAWVDSHTGHRHAMTEKPQLSAPKLTFGGLDEELFLAKDCQDLPDIL